MKYVYIALFASLMSLGISVHAQTRENLIVCNEGNWQSDNGQLSYYDGATGTLTNQWYGSQRHEVG